MKRCLTFVGVFQLQLAATVAALPVIVASPQSTLVAPGSNATFVVVASGADSFQWRHNGVDLPWATNASLTVTNAQSANIGYYMVVAKNVDGWVPSQMAHLSVAASPGGRVPFSNTESTHPQAQALYQRGYDYYYPPITEGTAQIIAGPELDQMQPIGGTYEFQPDDDGYFDAPDQYVPTVAPGQKTYYRVDIAYPVSSGLFTQQSTTISMVVGGGAYPTPVATNIAFPIFLEWPGDPAVFNFPPTNQVRVQGETVSFTLEHLGYTSIYGFPTSRWRKDGFVLTNATNIVWYGADYYRHTYHTLTITNLQPSDAGVYDGVVMGNQWLPTRKIRLSVLLNGAGLFQSPRAEGSVFLCDFQGAQGRRYAIEWSTNLSFWSNLLTLTNTTAIVTFSNAIVFPEACFYRSRLLP